MQVNNNPSTPREKAPELLKASVRFYSIGVVARAKERGSWRVVFTATDHLTMSEGELTDYAEEVEMEGSAADGSAYSGKAIVSNTQEAIWLPFESTNQRTAPDVRIGEEILIYQIADNDTDLFWTTFRDGFSKRRLETLTWLFSGDPNNPPNEDGSNCYGFTVSTHEGHITLKTSKANGEPFAYTIQINTKDGRLVLTDDVDNAFSIISESAVTEMKNAEGCFLRFQGQDGHLFVPGNFLREIGGNDREEVGGEKSEATSGSHTTEAGGARTVNSAGINHNSSGDSTSSSSGTTEISGSTIHLKRG